MSELDDLIFKIAQRGRAQNATLAYVGKTETDGSTTMDVPGRPSDIYITRRGNGEATVSAVEFRGGGRIAGYPVIIEVDPFTGREYVSGPSGSEAQRFLGERPMSYAPPHGSTHRRGGGDEIALETEQIDDGLVYFTSGLNYTVRKFRFTYKGRSYEMPESNASANSARPATASTKAWAIIGIDPTTTPPSFATVTGDEYPASFAIPTSAIDDIDYGNYIPLRAVQLTNGQTTQPQETDMQDMRTLVSSPVPLSNYTATTAPTVNDDSGDGYSVGSRWYNLTTDWEYVLLDATAGAAVWRLTTITSAASLPIHTHLDASNGGTLSAAAIASGTLALARGGTNADLSATGGANQFVKQSSVGGALSVAAILSADLTTALTTPPAIGGTTPAAGSFTTVSAVTSVSVGATVATIGNIRFPNNTGFAWRNAANTGNIQIAVDSGDNIRIGSTATSPNSVILFNLIGGSNTEVARFTGGSAGIGTPSPATRFHTVNSDANNNVLNIATIGRNTSATPAANLGGGLRFDLETTGTGSAENTQVARRTWELTNATHSSRAVLVKELVTDYGAERNPISWGGDGTQSILSFFAVTAVARAAALTQTYSTADRTLSAYTPDSEGVAYTGIDNAQVGTVYAQLTDLNALRVAYENLRALAEDLAQFVNSLVDDLQAYGLEQ